MSIHLTPGYTRKIEVKTSKGITIYEKTCSNAEELEQFVKTYSKSKPGWSWLTALACPLRTNNAKGFLQDLFFPTLITETRKTSNVAFKIFVSLFAIVLDVITFPVRLIAAPFRAIYNHQNQEKMHPLTALLKSEGTSIDEDVVTIYCKKKGVKIVNSPEYDKCLKRAFKDSAEGTVTVALRRFIGGLEADDYVKIKSLTYICSVNDEDWVEECNFSLNTKASFNDYLVDPTFSKL